MIIIGNPAHSGRGKEPPPAHLLQLSLPACMESKISMRNLPLQKGWGAEPRRAGVKGKNIARRPGPSQTRVILFMAVLHI
eukprot:262308-Pelagomonas_calceolata.AAC.1